MQGSTAIMDSSSLLLRQKLGLCLSTRTNLSNMTGSTTTSSAAPPSFAARCLFGPPDPSQATALVKEVEKKNVLQFGKRFNFHITEEGDGEPYTPAKKMRMTSNPTSNENVNDQVNDSDEENHHQVIGQEDEESDSEGYIWTETYNMTISIKPLLIAPMVLSSPINNFNQQKTIKQDDKVISSTSSPDFPTEQLSSSPSTTSPPSTSTSSKSSSPLSSSSSSSTSSEEPNNNNICDNKNLLNHNCKNGLQKQLKRNNRLNSTLNNHHHHQSQSQLQNFQPSVKKTSTSTTPSSLTTSAHHLITKYMNRVLRHAVVKKPKKAVITDYLQMRRTKNLTGTKGNGKK